jgi:hypothetical protein
VKSVLGLKVMSRVVLLSMHNFQETGSTGFGLGLEGPAGRQQQQQLVGKMLLAMSSCTHACMAPAGLAQPCWQQLLAFILLHMRGYSAKQCTTKSSSSHANDDRRLHHKCCGSSQCSLPHAAS